MTSIEEIDMTFWEEYESDEMKLWVDLVYYGLLADEWRKDQ